MTKSGRSFGLQVSGLKAPERSSSAKNWDCLRLEAVLPDPVPLALLHFPHVLYASEKEMGEVSQWLQAEVLRLESYQE